jgi:hypothetical protein
VRADHPRVKRRVCCRGMAAGVRGGRVIRARRAGNRDGESRRGGGGRAGRAGSAEVGDGGGSLHWTLNS